MIFPSLKWKNLLFKVLGLMVLGWYSNFPSMALASKLEVPHSVTPLPKAQETCKSALRDKKFINQAQIVEDWIQSLFYQRISTMPTPEHLDETGANEFSSLIEEAHEAQKKYVWPKNPLHFIEIEILKLPNEIRKISLDTISETNTSDRPSNFEYYFLSLLHPQTHLQSDFRPDGALRVMESIACLRDPIRTKKFLFSIKTVIRNFEKHFNHDLEFLEAGAGAIPLLSIYAALLSPKIRVTALELNPQSAFIAKQIVTALHLDQKIEIILADATQFKTDQTFDIIVSETLNTALSAEPVVQIFENLSKNIKDHGIMLPNKVQIFATMVPIESYFESFQYVRIFKSHHKIINNPWKKVAEYRSGSRLPLIQFELPLHHLPPGNYLVLLASVVHLGREVLKIHESLITMPYAIRDWKMDEVIVPISEKDDEGADEKDHLRTIQISYRPGDVLSDIITGHW